MMSEGTGCGGACDKGNPQRAANHYEVILSTGNVYMPVNKQVFDNGQRVTLVVDGHFKFDLVAEFRAAYTEEDPKAEFTIDLRGTDAMDSSALGMLLNMKSFLDKPDGEIKIINASGSVRKVLLISRFDKKFSIN